jgi:hypothetical protein
VTSAGFCPSTSGKEGKDLEGLRNLITQMAEAKKGTTKINIFEFQELIRNCCLLCLCVPGFWPFVSGTGNKDLDGATSSLKWKRRTGATKRLPTASQKRVLSKMSTSMSGVPVLNCRPRRVAARKA